MDMIIRAKTEEDLAFCSPFTYKMTFATFVGVIVKVVLGPETITNGNVLQLSEIHQVQPFQQQ